MLQIDNTIISDDVIEKKFACDLKACKGVCCVEGDSGAPLELDERKLLDKEYPIIKNYLRPQGIKAIEENGLYYIDEEHDYVTTLVDGKECAFTIFDNEGIAACGIEKTYEAGGITFRKPLSCWLYPVRTKEISDLEAVNYDVWDICKSAVLFGEKHNILAYNFLKEPLIKKFGEAWYKQLKYFAENSNKK